MQKEYSTKSVEETRAVGAMLAAELKGGELILLYGDLGAGKTQFVKGIAAGLGITDTVVSPTFTIERVYEGDHCALHHFDLYRTAEDEEILAEITDLVKDLRNIIVVEWPENMPSLMSQANYKVGFETVSEREREIAIERLVR